MKFLPALLIAFFLFPSFASAQDRIELGYQTTRRGVTWYRFTPPTHRPAWRLSRDTNAVFWVDTTTALRYEWDYAADVWHTVGLISSTLPPIPTKSSGSATLDHKTATWKNAAGLTHRYDYEQAAWVPIGGYIFQASAPSNVASSGSNGPAIYTTSIWQDSDDYALYYWDGSAWVPFSGLVAEPATQMVFGTGTGIDSDTGFIYHQTGSNRPNGKWFAAKGRMVLGHPTSDDTPHDDLQIRGLTGAGLTLSNMLHPDRNWQIYSNFDGFMEFNTIRDDETGAQTFITVNDSVSKITASWPIFEDSYLRFQNQSDPVIFFNPSGSNLYRKWQIGTNNTGTFGIRKINNGEFAGDYFLKAVADPSHDERVKRIELNANNNAFSLRNDTTSIDGNVYLTDYTGGAKDGTIAKGLGLDSNNKIVTGAAPGNVSGSGSAGQVTYWTGTNSISGSNLHWWDNTNKRLGIGTNAPRDLISLSGGNGAISWFNTTNPVPYVGIKWDQALDGLALMRNECCDSLTVYGMFMKRSGGNIGINTTSPTSFLDVNGDARVRTLSSTPTNILGSTSTGVLGNVTLSGDFSLSGGTFGLFTGASGQTIRHNGTSWIANSFLYNNGSGIGINTTSPGDYLHINGGGQIIESGSNGGQLAIKNGDGWDAYPLRLYEGGNEIMTVRQIGASNEIRFSMEGTSVGASKIGFKSGLNRGDDIYFQGSTVRFLDADDPYGEVMRIEDNKVGILTTSATNTLDVNGTARVRSLTGTATGVVGSTSTGVLTNIGLTGATVSGGNIVMNDQSSTNEIQTIDTFAIVSNTLRLSLSSDGQAFKTVDLSPYVNTATDLTFSGSSSPVTLNSSTGTDVTITAGGINSLSATSGNITITATEVDGSTTNELQTYSHSGTTSYTNTLSNSGGSFTLQGTGTVALAHSAGTTVFSVPTDGITSTEIIANGVGSSELASTAVTAGSYGSATQVGTFTVDADGRLTTAANTTITGTLSGLTATRIPFASSSNTLTDDALLTWNNTTKRVSIGNTGGSPSAALHIAEGSVASWEPLKAVGTVSGNMITTLSNAQNTGGASNNILQMLVGGASGGDVVQQYSVSGVGTWSAGVDNSNSDKYIVGYQSLPGGGSDWLTITTAGSVGIKDNAPATDLSVGGTSGVQFPSGTTAQRPSNVLPVMRYNSSVAGWEVSYPQGNYTRLTSAAVPTLAAGAGAGTSPTLALVSGGNDLFGTLQITTGTTPTAGATIVTVTFNSPLSSSTRISIGLECRDDNCLTQRNNFRVASVGTNSWAIQAKGGVSMPASTLLTVDYQVRN